MGFKLGSESRELRIPNKKTPIYRKNLEPGVKAEANNDGSIFIDHKVPANSKEYRETIAHELQHMKDMETGRAQYGDNWVSWEGKIYIRKTIDGKKFIDGPAGRLPEGHPSHPWEASAIEAEGNGVNITQGQDGALAEGVENEEVGEVGEDGTPLKWFGKKLWKKAKESKLGQTKLGKFALGGGIVGAAVRGLKGGDEGEEGAGADPCAECESSSSEDGDVRSLAAKAMGKAKRDKHKPYFQRLKEAKGDPEAQAALMKEQSGWFGGIGSMMSDRRLKKDIKLVGKSPSGLKIYTFKYIDGVCDNNTYEGVMSDEIPSNAVIKHTDGYDRVDYSKLDVDFKRI